MVFETIDIPFLLAANLAAIATMMLLLWVISIALRDVSFIDAFWAFGFVLVTCVTSRLFPFGGIHQQVLITLTVIWGLRLGIHLFARWLREGPDGRYVAMTSNVHGNLHLYTLKIIFGLQGIIMWVVSLPLQLGVYGATGQLGLLGSTGLCLAIFGIGFESVGDWQLMRFKADAANKGKVLDSGLWRFTRHPNYFGDLCFWWGCFAVACEAPYGWMSLPGPILMTYLLVKWSGAALLEKRLKRSRPAYANYIAKTSTFIPWPPKKA